MVVVSLSYALRRLKMTRMTVSVYEGSLVPRPETARPGNEASTKAATCSCG